MFDGLGPGHSTGIFMLVYFAHETEITLARDDEAFVNTITTAYRKFVTASIFEVLLAIEYI